LIIDGKNSFEAETAGVPDRGVEFAAQGGFRDATSILLED